MSRLIETKEKQPFIVLLPYYFLFFLIVVGIISIFYESVSFLFQTLLGIEVIILGQNYKVIKKDKKMFLIYTIVGTIIVFIGIFQMIQYVI